MKREESRPASILEVSPGPGGAAPAAGSGPRPRRLMTVHLAAATILAVSLAVLIYAMKVRYGESRFAVLVRESFAARRYEQAGEPLRRWLAAQPDSGEAQFYRTWLALAENRPLEAADALARAAKLRFDPYRLQSLTAIFQARSGHFNEAEPILRQAFDDGSEPRAEVARELARIYLKTYRLAQAGEPIERWKELLPDDPQPYMWSNEIASRSGMSASTLIRNYRLALERDPDLDPARLGLAEQLSKDRRFDEAEREFQTHLKRNPNDANALVGLGRNAFQAGDLEAASRHFEAALLVDPRQPEALKELALADLRRGEVKKACQRYERLIQVVPYEFDIRYAYAQALGCGPGVRTRAANTRMAHSGWVAGVGTRRVTPPGPPPRGPIPWGLCRPRRLRPQPPEGQAGPNEVLDDFWAGVA